MRPREEMISVGGIRVHTWVGGQGDPLLVLHGAGGNRGWTRWLAQVSERFTVWAPTHPGFERSDDADWMDGIDDLARFYLWFIETAKLGRPHVLGHSIGRWTAGEVATSSPCSSNAAICRRSSSPMPSRAWCSISSEEIRGDEALLLQRDAAPRVPRRGRRQVPVAPARVPEPLLRPREGCGQLPALPHGVRVRRPGGLRGPDDQRASLDAVVRERRREHDRRGARPHDAAGENPAAR